jgi:hypothetical protein
VESRKIWIEQCEAARGIEDEFGVQKALDYLIGEKFLNFLEVAETDAEFQAEIPAFVAKIKTIFERWQLSQYLETARETEPFDPSLFEPRQHPILGEEEIEFEADEIEEMRKGNKTVVVDAAYRDFAAILKEMNSKARDFSEEELGNLEDQGVNE